MRISSSAKYALGVTAAVAMLAGCNGGGSQLASTPSGPMQGAARVMGANGHKATHFTGRIAAGNPIVGKGKSIMNHVKHDTGNRLLYISDYANGVVQVYNYPSTGSQISPAGTLTGFSGPQGECTSQDKKSVFIANTNTSQIFEYAFGATSPSATISDPGNYPAGCSVDPMTGNLAVSNIISTAGGAGSIAVYTPPYTGSPTIYSNPNMFEIFFLSYDNAGNIFADGFNNSFFVQATELSGGTYTDLSTSNSILFPGGVNYDSRRGYVTIGDQSSSPGSVYGYTLSGTTLTLAQTTPMVGSGDVVQNYLKPGLTGIVAPDALNACASTYKYPVGGSSQPNKTICGVGLGQPIGAAIAKP